MSKKIDGKAVISFVILIVSFLFFLKAILHDWIAWSQGWGYFWIGILFFTYTWIIYCYEFY